MNGSRAMVESEIGLLAAELSPLRCVDVALCVPFPYLEAAGRLALKNGLSLGAQNLALHADGAHTGDVSAAMLKDFDCRYVLVGHSERRHEHAESDQMVLTKVRAALAASLTPIICIGESLLDRNLGRGQSVVDAQALAVLGDLTEEQRCLCVLAYEPVWAIGTGLSAEVQQIVAVHSALRMAIAKLDSVLSQCVPILYGGGVSPDSAMGLLREAQIDGVLVGKASLSARDFLSIIDAADHACA